MMVANSDLATEGLNPPEPEHIKTYVELFPFSLFTIKGIVSRPVP